jgi:hypothetical protein
MPDRDPTLYMQTLTQSGCYWLLQGPSCGSAVLAGALLPPHTHTQSLCVGGGGEGVDYDKLQRNMANSGCMRITRLKTT